MRTTGGREHQHQEAMYESGMGWPSFWGPISEQNIKRETGRSFFMTRVVVL
ncbi:MAG TPA: peptide-methionine (R)-S-oxide reductase [Nitrospirota bacterium]|nr:peptide-methionine (R)-S-oxide reductase [Nitrospirota bacterium]